MIAALRVRHGYILMPIVIAVALIATLAFLLSRESTQEINQLGNEIESARGEYLLRAGLQHALQETARQGCGPYTDMTNVSMDADSYSSVLSASVGTLTTYTVDVDQDTHIKQDKPTENKGIDGSIHIQSDFEGKTEIALLRYDLSGLPANAPILSATAWFYLDRHHAQGTVDLHLVNTDWTELDANWLNMNDGFDLDVFTSIPPQSETMVWVPVNLTSQVQAWVNGEEHLGIAFTGTANGLHGQYESRDSSHPPYLEVVVGTPPSPKASLSVSGTLANGSSGSISRSDITLRQYPAKATQLSAGVGAAQDAVLDALSSTSNFGIHDLEVETGSGEQVSLIQFDLPAIPPDARVVSAQLELFHFLTSDIQEGAGADIHRVTRSWVEGTRSGAGGADGATWSTWDGENDWLNAGGEYEQTPVANSEISLATNDWERWEIGGLVQGWIDGTYPNHGLIVKGSGNLDVSFSSGEDVDAELHPRLTIRYTCACGQVCVAPEGAGNLLLVVNDATALTSEELLQQQIFESWGYSVTILDQNATKPEFDAELPNLDVVFISESITKHDQVTQRVLDFSIGVVSQGDEFIDRLGIGSGHSWKTGNSIEITDNTHYITQIFGEGPLRIYNADMDQAVATGAMSLSSQTLAENDTDAALVVIEAGGLLQAGGNAAGRRVTLPTGRVGNIDWNELSANGRLLVQRSLEWAATSIGSISSGNLLMVVEHIDDMHEEEESKQALFESWGFTVSLIDDSDSAAEFDAALLDTDVVFVTRKVSQGKVDDILVDVTAGIVLEEVDLADELGFADDLHKDSDTDLVTTNTHYITLPLNNGPHTILTRSRDLVGVDGTTAFDLEMIGSSDAGNGLVTLDTGDSTLIGTAAGRRVLLPWGDSGYKVKELTGTGLMLLQRSLEWAAGANAPPMLMLVVADPSLLSSRESSKMTEFEALGYIVYLADDDDPPDDLLRLANALDVVYVSESINPAVLGDKLSSTSTGLVNESGGMLDNFGFSDTTTGVIYSDRFDKTSVSHHVTTIFDGAAVTHFTGSLAMPVVSGNLAPGLITAASVGPLVWVLPSLDRNAQRWDTGASAGRRLHLPFGQASMSQLTEDGTTLLYRSLEWAYGAEEPQSIIARWKLDDSIGTTAIDSVGWNDATLAGNPVWIPSILDGALQFDGGNDYATTINNFRPPPIGSVAFWMQVPGEPSDDGQILGLADDWEIRHVSDGTSDGIPSGLVFDLGVADSNNEFVTTVELDAANQWYFVVATYDSESNAYQVYLDGEPHKSGIFAAGLTMPAASPLSLGRRTGSNDDFTGSLDDVRIYNYILSEDEIQDLYIAGTPNAKRYFEVFETIEAPDDDRWEVISLESIGVPADAVVEVVITNKKDKNERWGGVRAVGSVLERRLQLHEAEGRGVDAITMHVQADSASQIEVYSDKDSEVHFVIVGYWTGSSYQEKFQTFDETAAGLWVDENLFDQGIGANQVVEMLLVNVDDSNERQAGVRSRGSTQNRLFTLHEAEGNGTDAVSLMVVTDAASTIQVFSENLGEIEFHVLGSWSDPPGVYTELAAAPLQVTSTSTWEPLELGPLGVPAESVVQLVMANKVENSENFMGTRRVISPLEDRSIQLHEAEAGGGDFVSLHVRVNSASQVEAYANYGNDDSWFYPAGWWALGNP